MADDVVSRTFRAFVESADKKFARVRDLPTYGGGGGGGGGRTAGHYFHKVFKAYTRLWKYQQENRKKLVEAGLHRSEIGEIASRIGQLYYGQYMRTSEIRFLIGAFIFYEAILNRKYFEGSEKERGLRFKELRFYARFLMVSLMLNCSDMVNLLVDKFKALVDDSRVNFPEINFKEWKQVVLEIVRFTNADAAFLYTRPLRYSVMFDSYPSSLPYVTRFHAKKVLKFQDAVLTSYHKNEIKFAEQTLDTYRMLQCLEWEPTGPSYQKRVVESRENGGLANHSVASGMIDMHLAADMIDPTLPPNPKKAVLYRPSVTQLVAVIATICAELPPERVMLIYLSAPGNASRSGTSHIDSSRTSRRTSRLGPINHNPDEKTQIPHGNHSQDKGLPSHYYENYLWLGPCRNGGSNCLYPGDMIPFTRRPLFFIIDSDNSHAFKVLHGAERGETTALLLSPLKPSFKNPSGADVTENGSQFTFFLAAPLQAFCQLVGFKSSDSDVDIHSDADSIMSVAFAEWEVTLSTSTTLNLVWAQVLSDPFLRRLILRFIFCRAVLTLFRLRESSDHYLPVCLPELPDSVAPHSEAVLPSIVRLANHLKVANFFQLHNS